MICQVKIKKINRKILDSGKKTQKTEGNDYRVCNTDGSNNSGEEKQGGKKCKKIKKL